MRRLAVVLAFAALCWGCTKAAETPDKSPTANVATPRPRGGWSKARFGMSPQEVKAAFAGEAKDINPPDKYEKDTFFAPLGIDDTRIGPMAHADVRFEFPRASAPPSLSRIYVTEGAIPPLITDDDRMRREYDDLVNLLTEKYGQSATSTRGTKADGDVFEQRTTWLQKDVIVELSYQHMTMYGHEISCFLSVDYREPTPDSEKARL